MNQNNNSVSQSLSFSDTSTNPCVYIGMCGSCQLGHMTYEEQLRHKTSSHIENFREFYDREFEIFSSTPVAFRARAEFKLYHNDGKVKYAMVDKDKSYLCVDKCLIVNEQIQTIMPKLLVSINNSEILLQRVFMVEFMTSEDEILVTLVYHKKLENDWIEEAKKLQEILNIKLIGRSRGQKIVLSDDFITNKLKIDNSCASALSSRKFNIIQKEGAFSQPNRYMNTQMVSWVLDNVSNSGDLCELYCGGGNFTLPLSTKFDKVLATEISKTSIASAKESCKLNDIDNIEFIRMSSEEFTSALKGEREFNRLKDVDLSKYSFSKLYPLPSTTYPLPHINYHLSTIFVDPPRSGLDNGTVELVSKFDTIIYISCSPDTLYRDIKVLSKTHNVIKFAFFDQFVWSEHIESGAILTKK
ncbi:MAG: tRNA (uridine(54)-C5)-methyltransferase TrmA [Arcobacteraceae bacterium]|nr:tRNA (uridine(54)-C5)-methyltransferase TrmA [Arcobacteraceae bacterium]